MELAGSDGERTNELLVGNCEGRARCGGFGRGWDGKVGGEGETTGEMFVEVLRRGYNNRETGGSER